MGGVKKRWEERESGEREVGRERGQEENERVSRERGWGERERRERGWGEKE